MTSPIPKREKALKSGHTRARAPVISLHQPGRLRVAHMLSLLGVSHATFYKRKAKGLYPWQDGIDGRMPYWNTETVRKFLEGQ